LMSTMHLVLGAFDSEGGWRGRRFALDGAEADVGDVEADVGWGLGDFDEL